MNFRNVCTHKISRNTAPKHNRSIRERAIIIFIKKKKIIPVRSTLSQLYYINIIICFDFKNLTIILFSRKLNFNLRLNLRTDIINILDTALVLRPCMLCTRRYLYIFNILETIRRYTTVTNNLEIFIS